METSPKYTLAEAHLQFAKSLNKKVWELLQQETRSSEDDELMIHCAHASCFHWLQAGNALNHQRAEWLIAHVYSELGYAEPALRHAARCLALTGQHAALMQDFDLAYSYEGMARASALAGKKDDARRYEEMAERSGQAIKNDEDRAIFQGDLAAGDWHGIR